MEDCLPVIVYNIIHYVSARDRHARAGPESQQSLGTAPFHQNVYLRINQTLNFMVSMYACSLGGELGN